MIFFVKLFFFGLFFIFVEVRDYGWNICVYLKIKNLIRLILLIWLVIFLFVKVIFFLLKVDKFGNYLYKVYGINWENIYYIVWK